MFINVLNVKLKIKARKKMPAQFIALKGSGARVGCFLMVK